MLLTCLLCAGCSSSSIRIADCLLDFLLLLGMFYWSSVSIMLVSKILTKLQDADRLDSIGAAGIGRTFTYSGSHEMHMQASRDLFDTKLFSLVDHMKTSAGKQMAMERTRRLQCFADWWDEETFRPIQFALGDSKETDDLGKIKVACVPAQHNSARTGIDKAATLWAGFVVEQTSTEASCAPSRTAVYFAG